MLSACSYHYINADRSTFATVIAKIKVAPFLRHSVSNT